MAGAVGALVGVRHELVAPPVDRAHHLLRRAGVTDSAAQGLDATGEGRLAYEPVTPHLVEDLFLGDDSPALAYEQCEHVEHLRLDLADGAIAPQLELVEVELA